MRLLPRVGYTIELLQQGLFGKRQMRIPYVEYQHNPHLVAVIPCFMFDRIIERKGLTLAPRPRFSANSKGAVARNDQRQMNDCATIRHAGVRRNVTAGL